MSYSTSTVILSAFSGADLDPAQLITMANILTVAVAIANALPPAARVVIAQSSMGTAARNLAEELLELANTLPADDLGDDVIPASQPGRIETTHVYNGQFSIPLGNQFPSLTGVQNAYWIVKKCFPSGGGDPILQLHSIDGKIYQWDGSWETWDDSMDPQTDTRWQIIT